MIRTHLLVVGAAFITTLAIAPDARAATKIEVTVEANGTGVTAKMKESAEKEISARFEKDGRNKGELNVRTLAVTAGHDKPISIKIVITGFDKDGDGDADRFKLHLALQDDDDDDVDFSDDEADEHDAVDDAAAASALLANLDKMIDKTAAYLKHHHE